MTVQYEAVSGKQLHIDIKDAPSHVLYPFYVRKSEHTENAVFHAGIFLKLTFGKLLFIIVFSFNLFS